MLPFLKNKEGSVSAPTETIHRESDEESDFDSLEVAAQDLCDAIHSKDYKGVASALRAAFDLLESEPHSEGSTDNG